MNTKTQLRRMRENKILSSLDKFGVLTVDQFQTLGIAGFGECSKRNVLRVLAEMEKDGHITSKNVGKKLFAPFGANFGYWEHRLLLIDFLLWKGWHKVPFWIERVMEKNGEEIKPDAIVKQDGEYICIEVDRRQKKITNLQKVKKYKEMKVRVIVVCYQNRSHHFPDVEKVFIEEMHN